MQGEERVRRNVPVAPPPKTAEEIARDQLKDGLIEGDIAKVKQLMNANQRIKLNEPVLPYEGTPLMIACQYGQLEMVKHLLNECYADANVYVNNRTALFAACSSKLVNDQHEKRLLDIVKLLLEKNVTVNRPCGSLRATPVMIAIENGHDSVVHHLLSLRTAALESADAEQSTVIFYAVQFRRPAIVGRLIAMGANLEATNREGCTPYELAETLEFDDIIGLFPDRDTRYVSTEYQSISSHYYEIIPTAFAERKM